MYSRPVQSFGVTLDNLWAQKYIRKWNDRELTHIFFNCSILVLPNPNINPQNLFYVVQNLKKICWIYKIQPTTKNHVVFLWSLMILFLLIVAKYIHTKDKYIFRWCGAWRHHDHTISRSRRQSISLFLRLGCGMI